MKYSLLIIVLIAAVAGCKKPETDFEAIDLGYNYFPTKNGWFIDYEVDSISHNITVDTTHFFLREKMTEDFIDEEGQVAWTLERYKKNQLQDTFELTDVWVQKRTTTSAEKVEENQRFIKLVFPVEENDTWNGNAYNSMDPWNYRYTNVGDPYEIDFFDFPNTVTVNQRNNINLVDQEVAYEVYADGIGLIYKSLKDLEYQNFEITGVEIEMKAIGYGTLE